MQKDNDKIEYRDTLIAIVGPMPVAIATFGALCIGLLGVDAIYTIDSNSYYRERNIKEMSALNIDEQIDKFYMRGMAFLDCRAGYEYNKRNNIINYNPPYRSIEDGVTSKSEVRRAIRDDGCFLRYGLRPVPFCGYGDCWAVALLIFSCAFATA